MSNQSQAAVGEIVFVTDQDHDWNGKRVLVVDVSADLLIVELPEQQSFSYHNRLICSLRKEQIGRMSEMEQLQTTNQMPIGFETRKKGESLRGN